MASDSQFAKGLIAFPSYLLIPIESTQAAPTEYLFLSEIV